jgi:hypothetical protein
MTSTSWFAHRDATIAIGGHLATITSPAEDSFVQGLIPQTVQWLFGPTIGLFQLPGAAEPDRDWQWVTGEPFQYSGWFPGEPNNGPGYGEHWVRFRFTNGTLAWNDVGESAPAGEPLVSMAIVEWSADCNSDGIVDYGQCYDGTLPDYNGNNVPECCESGEACVVGNYPVQWRVIDGGNGHWYGMHAINQDDMTWMQMREAATRLGGHLITLSNAEEDAFGFRFFAGLHEEMMAGPLGYFVMPGGQWESVTGEPISYSNWRPAMTQPPLAAAPDNGNTLHRFATWLDPSWGPVAGSWEDWQDSELGNPADPISRFLIEWDADCNNDGVVDYGQILLGQIVDTNTNGIPDICEGPTCNDIDLNLNGIVDGGDLGVLLAFWGPVSPAFPRADINKDGFVNGADLGIVLAFWGPCPN